MRDWLNGEGDATTEEDLRGGRNGGEFEGTFRLQDMSGRVGGVCLLRRGRSHKTDSTSPLGGMADLPINWHVLLIHLNFADYLLVKYYFY